MRSDWDRRAVEAPFYYAGFAGWEQSLDTFIASGREHAGAIEFELSRLRRENAGPWVGLEIGCGPGRLMAALGGHFKELHGVDVSGEMIRLARDVLRDSPHLHPHVNNGADLRMFPDGHFDFVYSYAVFQHIPCKPVVLSYLREARRVLKSDGVLRAQFDSLPESGPADTWTGCSFSAAEIAHFADANGFALLAISGEGTHYMWTTMRKIAPRGADLRDLTLLAVTSPAGARSIPQRGRGAAVSLWIRGAVETDGLTDFTVRFNGQSQRGCYLSPIADGCAFINALLPKNIGTGMAKVGLTFQGAEIGEEHVEILPVARAPRIVSITDSVDKLSNSRIACGTMKVTLEDIADPTEVRFIVADMQVVVAHTECLDPHLDQYYFTVELPAKVPKGPCAMTVAVPGADLPAAIEVV